MQKQMLSFSSKYNCKSFLFLFPIVPKKRKTHATRSSPMILVITASRVKKLFPLVYEKTQLILAAASHTCWLVHSLRPQTRYSTNAGLLPWMEGSKNSCTSQWAAPSLTKLLFNDDKRIFFPPQRICRFLMFFSDVLPFPLPRKREYSSYVDVYLCMYVCIDCIPSYLILVMWNIVKYYRGF